MTTDDFIKKQEAKIKKNKKSNKPLMLAVKSIMAVQAKRIFLDGQNAEGGIIGEYKGGEIYVSPNQNKGLPKFPLKGKDGKKKFKNGKAHKTGYFNDYLQFKETIGRNKKLKSVDLFLTGTLLRNWANAKTLAKANAVKVSENHYKVALTQDNWDKAARYGNVFGLSKTEKESFLNVLKFELTKTMSK